MSAALVCQNPFRHTAAFAPVDHNGEKFTFFYVTKLNFYIQITRDNSHYPVQIWMVRAEGRHCIEKLHK